MRSRSGWTVPALVIALAASRPASASDTARPTPTSSRAVAFAVSSNVRNLPAARPAADSNLPAEWVRENDRLPRSDGPFPPGPRTDGTLVAPHAAAPSTPTMPAPAASFAGISADDVGAALGSRWVPPDTVGDVGPNHYVQAVNVVFRVYDKGGTPLTPIVSFHDFFSTLGSGCARNDGDPIVLYDPLADRWLISQFGLPNYPNPPFHQCVAISKSGDPTGDFYLYDFLMPVKLNDYPHFGVWPDGYYMSDNQFAPGGGGYAGAGFFAFDRLKMLAGDPTAAYIYFDYFGIDPFAGGMIPSDLDGLTPPPPGTPNFFWEFRADEFGDPLDALRIYEFHADFADPANATLTVRPDLPVAAFDARVPAGRTAIEEPPPATSADDVDAVADRMMHRAAYRTLAGGAQSFVVNWTVNVSGVNPVGASTYQAGVRFTELRRDSGTGAFSIQNQVTYAPGFGNGATGRNVWMGSTAQDNAGNSVVGFSASSTTLFPSIIWAGRLATDPPDDLTQGEATVASGTGSQQQSFNRWGDYSAMSIDPSDDCTFFETQEYYVTSNAYDWATRVATFAYPTCSAAPSGSVSGIVKDCGTGLPLPGAYVTDGLGHVRVTDAAGHYTMTLPPGSYTLTISKPTYSTAGGPVTITAGGGTTLNGCIAGIPVIASTGATLSAEGCLPANGIPDPGETVTVTFCMQNTGSADTTDLVATLEPSGGVTSPSGAADFGVLVAGGPAVCRDVSFTVDPDLACGQTLVATLNLTDGAASLGAIPSSFPAGIPTVVFTQGFDGVTAPALPAGWTATNPVGPAAPLWATTTSVPDSGANAAFVPDPTVVSDRLLDSPAIPISTQVARLTFRNNFSTEESYDGGVLEISVGGGAFQDILDAGGSFVSGGYTKPLVPSSNPLAGRSAWTGNSGGYVTTVVDLPASAAGSTVILRWRLGADDGLGGAGWRIDTISLSDGYACCATPSEAALAADAHASSGPSNVNGVWEPGETVLLETSYVNNSTTGGLALAGAASALTGPPGASYTVVDPTAAYGTLASGATGDCFTVGNCFTVSVDAPAARPAPHWDASLSELLSTGQTRTWTLHLGASFADVPSSSGFYPFVENIFHNGVTGGCGVGTYCPGANVTRAQMAVFLLKSKHGAAFVPPPCAGIFGDVACPSLFADWIEELSAEGITGGCGGGNYCPGSAVTRAQMSAFLLKGEHGSSYVPPACHGVFDDVACPSQFADWIEQLSAEGVTAGCGGSNYCPASPNTRGQMAVFLAKTFGLLLYGP